MDMIIDTITELQSDPDKWKRRDAAFKLENNTNAEVTRCLVDAALKENDSNVLEAIAIALGNGDREPNVIPALERIVAMEGRTYQWSRQRAIEALKELTKMS